MQIALYMKVIFLSIYDMCLHSKNNPLILLYARFIIMSRSKEVEIMLCEKNTKYPDMNSTKWSYEYILKEIGIISSPKVLIKEK